MRENLISDNVKKICKSYVSYIKISIICDTNNAVLCCYLYTLKLNGLPKLISRGYIFKSMR